MKKIIEQIIAFFKARDKQLHILAGFGIAALIYILVIHVQPWWVAMLFGAVISSAIVVVKEFYDKQNSPEHKFDYADLIAGELGVFILILAGFINLG